MGTPVPWRLLEPSLRDMLANRVGGNVGDAKSRQRRLNHMWHTAEGNLPSTRTFTSRPIFSNSHA